MKSQLWAQELSMSLFVVLSLTHALGQNLSGHFLHNYAQLYPAEMNLSHTSKSGTLPNSLGVLFQFQVIQNIVGKNKFLLACLK